MSKLCNLSRSWPKAFVVDYFTNPIKDGNNIPDKNEIGAELEEQFESGFKVEVAGIDPENDDLNTEQS